MVVGNRAQGHVGPHQALDDEGRAVRQHGPHVGIHQPRELHPHQQGQDWLQRPVPAQGGWYVTSLSFNIRGYNSKGKGPTRTSTRSYGVARTPEVSALEQAEGTGHVSCTIKSDEGHDYRDRLNTMVTIDVEDTRKEGSARNTSIVRYTSATSYTAEYDVEDRFHLTYEQYVRVRVTAQARGYSGPSANASQEIYVGWPNKPVIITEQVSCPTREQLGKVTIPIDLMRTNEHPSTGVRLQVLANVEYETAGEIPGDVDWKDVGVPDDGDCTALSVDASLVMPETEGRRSWVRVKSWNQIEDGFYRYSDYYQLKELYTPRRQRRTTSAPSCPAWVRATARAPW